MIKANELRIGNLVISNFRSDRICKTVGINNFEAALQFADDENLQCISYAIWDLIHPIPLTEEWLLKFNKWKKEGDLYIRRLDTIVDSLRLDYINDDGELCWEFYVHNIRGEKVGCAYIKHVHSLQNLYFALTGEELILNI